MLSFAKEMFFLPVSYRMCCAPISEHSSRILFCTESEKVLNKLFMGGFQGVVSIIESKNGKYFIIEEKCLGFLRKYCAFGFRFSGL